jgi:pimeloyl-ACP methyl ester carboxylesterase
MIGCRTACSVNLGFLVLALLGCSSSSDTTNVQGPYDWDELVGATVRPAPIQSFQARSGSTLFYRSYGEQSALDLILMHGSGADSAYLSSLATWISSSGIARVWTPDVRGHGASPVRRGDIDYIGQLEDDLADLSSLIR